MSQWVKQHEYGDRGSQYQLTRYRERLAPPGIATSTINCLFKIEVLHYPERGRRKTFEAFGYATLDWVDWFNHRRLLEINGDIPPAEFADILLTN